MTGVTIDHLIATTAFIAAVLLFTGLFTQTLQTAILYQQNRHISLKAIDLLDNILLSPGYPYNWGGDKCYSVLFWTSKAGNKRLCT
jgi:hypothetical protein